MHLSVPQTRFFFFVFEQTATTIYINLPSQVYIVLEQTAAIKKNLKSPQKFC